MLINIFDVISTTGRDDLKILSRVFHLKNCKNDFSFFFFFECGYINEKNGEETVRMSTK